MISKANRIKFLKKIYLEKQEQIVRCDVDLGYYVPKAIITKDVKTDQYIQKKITDLKAIKARAKEIADIIVKQMLELKSGKKKGKKSKEIKN